MQTLYDRPVRLLMHDMEKSFNLSPGVTFTRDEAVAWFQKHYPRVNPTTVRAHLTRFSTNAPSRLHYDAIPVTEDIFFQVDKNTYRLYDSEQDPAPYSKENPPEEEEKNGYAKPYDQLFKDIDSELILDCMKEVLEALKKSEGFSEDKLTISRRGTNERPKQINILYYNWKIFSFTLNEKDQIRLASHARHGFSDRIHHRFSEETSSGHFHLIGVDMSWLTGDNEEAWGNYLADLSDVVECFSRYNNSNFKRLHQPLIEELILDKERREELLLVPLAEKEVDITEDEAAHDSVVGIKNRTPKIALGLAPKLSSC